MSFLLIYLLASVAVSLILGAFISVGSNKTEDELEFEKKILEEARLNAGVQF